MAGFTFSVRGDDIGFAGGVDGGGGVQVEPTPEIIMMDVACVCHGGNTPPGKNTHTQNGTDGHMEKYAV